MADVCFTKTEVLYLSHQLRYIGVNFLQIVGGLMALSFPFPSLPSPPFLSPLLPSPPLSSPPFPSP